MEAYLPGAECTGSSGSNDLDLCNHHFLWMLSSGNLIQQNKAQGRITDDPKDLCIYVDHCNGTSASVLAQRALSNRLTIVAQWGQVLETRDKSSVKRV
mgnify:CR=1 FL=1